MFAFCFSLLAALVRPTVAFCTEQGGPVRKTKPTLNISNRGEDLIQRMSSQALES